MESDLEMATREAEEAVRKKLRDEKLLSDLIAKATEAHKVAFPKHAAKPKKEYQKKTGHMLQSMYGKSVWMIKDLNAGQLLDLISVCERHVKKVSHCCGAPLEQGTIEVPNYQHRFDSSLPETKLSIRNFCSLCKNRNRRPPPQL